MPEADRHDTSAIYLKTDLGGLEAEIPSFGWRDYFQTTFSTSGLTPEEPIVSYAFPYLKKMAIILKHSEPR